MKLIPLDIKLTDIQFFEIKKFSALQIAGAFGIKPNQINEAREYLDKPKEMGGDRFVMNGNYIPIEMVGK